jgi:hypothetical protein
MVTGGFGVQIGDNNTQKNVFGSAVPSIGAQDLALWWSETWLPFTDPPLTAEVVLAGRQEAAAALRAALSGDRSVIAVGGDRSVLDLKAFLAASLVDDLLGGQAVFVGDPAGLATMLSGTDPRILMLVAGTEPAGLRLAGPHKIVLYGHRAVHPAVTVPAVDGDAVARLLVASAMERGRARRCGALARRGLEQLRQALSRYPECPEAAWAVDPDVVCRRLSLLGEFTTEDSEVIAGFTGLRHAELMDRAGRLITDPDLPLLGRLDGRWYVQGQENAFLLLRKSFTAQDLTDFAELAVQVLSAGAQASGALRRGVARSLVLLSVHGGDLRYGPSATPATHLADGVVREVLAGASTAGRVALTDVVDLLAEAAPGTFLNVISASPGGHPPFLSALELLARPTEHFDDAVDALARLAAADPGGRPSNRAAESLVGVFDCRFPQTRASRRVRLRALRRLLTTHPGVARTLLPELLPHGSVIRTAHPEPQFRAWPVPEGASPDDVDQAFRDVAALAIGDAGTDPGRCAELVPKIDAMPPGERAAFTEVLATLEVTDTVLRQRLFDALADLIAQHRQHAGEPWALTPAEVDGLARIAASFTPERAADRHRWLFADRWPLRGAHAPGWDVELARSRADAAGEILTTEGISALLVLADETGNGDLIGSALPRQADEDQLMSWLTGDRAALAFAYFAARIREQGHAKRTELLGRADGPDRQAAILLASRDPRWAWEQLESLDGAASEAYWRRFPTFGLGHDFDGVAEAAAGLNGVRRCAAALALISLYSAREQSAAVAVQAAAACEGFAGARDTDPEAHLVSKHDLQTMIDVLARCPEVIERRRIIAIELSFSSRIGSMRARLPTTSALLEEDPAFFAELVVTAFRGEHREMRNAAYRALKACTRCPGTGLLRAWVEQARAPFAGTDLRQVGDQMIAGVLVHAMPSAFDEIGELLEEIRSDDLDVGLRNGLSNRRGMTWRGMTDGGGQERTLAGDYRELALRAEDFPRLRRILQNLADRYEHEGVRQESQAEGYRRDIS